MKIVDLRATTITVPLEAPLRHSNGAHWGRFVRTIVEIETDVGLIGVGEMGGGGESAELAVKGLKPYLVGHDPIQLEQLRWKIMNPVASLYNNRMQLHAAIEFACMDVVGKFLNIRACDLLGGAIREEVPFASYIFYRYRDNKTGKGGETTPDEIVAHARECLLLVQEALAGREPFFVTDDAMLSHDRYLGIRGSCGLHYRRAVAARLISCVAPASSSRPCARASTAPRRAARRYPPG